MKNETLESIMRFSSVSLLGSSGIWVAEATVSGSGRERWTETGAATATHHAPVSLLELILEEHTVKVCLLFKDAVPLFSVAFPFRSVVPIRCPDDARRQGVRKGMVRS
jgi:hypothetical protein